jgi:hypothetical protein
MHVIPVDLYRFQCIKENLSHSELLSIENIRDFKGAILIWNFQPLDDLLRMANIFFWIHHTQIRIKNYVGPNTNKMPLDFTFSENWTWL